MSGEHPVNCGLGLLPHGFGGCVIGFPYRLVDVHRFFERAMIDRETDSRIVRGVEDRRVVY
jgi:hypothetical protein